MNSRPRLPARLRRQIAKRAGGRCEYCKIPIRCDVLPPVIDHIIAIKHGGAHDIANLAYCCAHCNAFKGSNIAGLDPRSAEPIRLFNPRKDIWTSHFRWKGPVLLGITPIGRTTIAVLAINDSFKLAARESLMNEGKY